MVEDTLLGVKGVVSFTFNMSQRRCVLRVRTDVKPEVACRALEATKVLTVKHVIKNENGEEVSTSTHVLVHVHVCIHVINRLATMRTINIYMYIVLLYIHCTVWV